MNLKQAAITVAIAGAVSIAGADKASAALVTVDCTSPTIDLNPPPSGSAVSTCDALAPLPVGAIVTDITLDSRYSVTLQIGGIAGSAEMGHTTNVDTAFDNGGATTPTLATQPFVDLGFGPVACPSAACTAALNALLAGTVSITTYADTPLGNTSGVSGDYEWQVNYTIEQVPEPATMALFGLAMLGTGIARRRRRS